MATNDQDNQDACILVVLASALVPLIGFVFWENHSSTPMLNLRIFRNATISASVLVLTLASFGMTGGLFFLTQYLQLVLGLLSRPSGSVPCWIACAARK